jgi:hypothetical protein
MTCHLSKGVFSDHSVPIDIKLLISGTARYLGEGTHWRPCCPET